MRLTLILFMVVWATSCQLGGTRRSCSQPGLFADTVTVADLSVSPGFLYGFRWTREDFGDYSGVDLSLAVQTDGTVLLKHGKSGWYKSMCETAGVGIVHEELVLSKVFNDLNFKSMGDGTALGNSQEILYLRSGNTNEVRHQISVGSTVNSSGEIEPQTGASADYCRQFSCLRDRVLARHFLDALQARKSNR